MYRKPQSKLEAIKRLDKLKADLYNKWLGTHLEPHIRGEIEFLAAFINTM